MCGFLGVWQRDRNCLDTQLQRALESMRHRGPDDEGYLLWDLGREQYALAGGKDTSQGVFLFNAPFSPKKHVSNFFGNYYNLILAHRRLSIIDLSPAGHQPMCNEDASVWIVFNGEIYNFYELKRELSFMGHKFVSNTDTEVIIHAYEEWGTECLSRFNGMWAFCIWDARICRLFCSRDRLGIKPFYYFFNGNQFFFASEIKPLLYMVSKKPNEAVIYEYLVHGLLDHTSYTFFEGIQRLQGGEYLEFDLVNPALKISRYWTAEKVKAEVGKSEEENAERLYELLKDAVRMHLISDVPVGTCLSGGLDSSVIVCLIDQLMRENGLKILGSDIQRTFSARYNDKRYDEGKYIDAVLKKVQAESYVVYPNPQGLLQNIERIIYYQEEPFGSTSIYAQWSVFQLVKNSGTKVTLDGQGADELLGGYTKFFKVYMRELLKTWQLIRFIAETGLYVTNRIPFLLTKLGIETRFIYRVAKTGLYPWLSTSFKCLNLDWAHHYGLKFHNVSHKNLHDVFIKDLTEISLPVLLRYADKNSMANSIESRVPYLDYRIVEFLLAIPESQKISKGVNKRVLRKASKGLIPDIVLSRNDKIGFCTPERFWFQEGLRSFIETIVTSEQFLSRPYFNPTRIFSLVEAYMHNIISDSAFLWRIINLELWLRMFID